MAFKCRIIESRNPLTLSEQQYSVHEIDHFSESLTYGIAIEIDGQIYEATIEHSTKAEKHFRKKVPTSMGTSNEVRFVKDNSLHEMYIDALLKDNLILSKKIILKQEYPCHFHLCCKRVPNCNRKVKRNIQEYPLNKYFDICERGTFDPITGLTPDIVLRSSTNEKRIAWVEVLDTHGCEPLKLLKTRYSIYEISISLDIDEEKWEDDDNIFRYYQRFSISDINTYLCGLDAFNSERQRQIARQITLRKQMPVGKYKGWTIEKILKKDPEHITWMKKELQEDKTSFKHQFTFEELTNL